MKKDKRKRATKKARRKTRSLEEMSDEALLSSLDDPLLDNEPEKAGFFSRVRFLPLMIFAAALLLPMKVNNVWDGIGDILSRPVSVAKAQEVKEAAPEAPAASTPAMPDAPGGVPGLPTAQTGMPSADKSAAVASLLSEDPTLLTQSEIDLLQKLAERREALEGREREINIREGMLKAAETRIDKKVSEFKNLQVTIQGLIKTYDGQQASKVESLVKIYENMKPKDAARIFEELDMDTLLSVAERMKERKLAPVMAEMNPVKAREVTVELSQRRELPKTAENTGG